MIKKVEVIISENEKIKDVFPEFTLLKNEDALGFYSKIDLVIIDKKLSNQAIKKITKISDRIINLVDDSNIENVATLLKPFRLYKLLEIANHYRQNKFIFCLINDEILYSQRASYISHQDKQIKLTDKENELFAAILTAPDYVIAKEALLSKVWGYAKDIETSTLDTHLTRLRSYLPAGFINNKDGIISLDIKNII